MIAKAVDRIHLNVCLHVNEPELWNWKWVKEIQVSGKKLSICRAKENMNNEGEKHKTFAKRSQNIRLKIWMNGLIWSSRGLFLA